MLLKIIIIAVILLLIIGLLFFLNFAIIMVDGNSMSPTLKNEQLIICRKRKRNLKIGDIVAYKKPNSNTLVIKRIVGVGGDTLKIKGQKLYVNNSLCTDYPYIISDQGCLDIPYTVPQNSIFCMGDNANQSTDSRSYGSVSINRILGVIIFKTK